MDFKETGAVRFGIDLDSEGFEKAEEMLKKTPDKFKLAQKYALNRAVNYIRSASTREITKVYSIKADDVRSGENVRISRNFWAGEFAHNIIYSSKRIPLSRFDISPKDDFWDEANNRGYPLYAHVLKSTPKQKMKDGFVVRFDSGHLAAVTRIGEGRLPLGGRNQSGEVYKGEYLGPAVPQMLNRDEILEKLRVGCEETYSKRFLHEAERLISDTK